MDMSIRLGLLLILSCASYVRGDATYAIEHSFGGAFSPRGSLEVTEDSRGNVAIKILEAGTIETNELQAFKDLVARDGFYTIRARGEGSDATFVVASIKACQLFLGGFKEKLIVRLHEDGDDFSSLEYANPHFGGTCDSLIASKKKGTIRLKTAAIVVRPEVARVVPLKITGNMFIKGAEKLSEGGKGNDKENKGSFFQRYWHVIVPVMIVMLISNVVAPPPQGGNGGSAASG